MITQNRYAPHATRLGPPVPHIPVRAPYEFNAFNTAEQCSAQSACLIGVLSLLFASDAVLVDVDLGGLVSACMHLMGAELAGDDHRI